MAEPLRAQFGHEVAERLARELHAVHATFPTKAFLRDALLGFDRMELLERGRHLADVLQRHLPPNVSHAIDLLVQTLPTQPSAAGGMVAFFYLPHTEFIRRHAIEYFGDAMGGLHALTQHFTGEWAIRPFIERYPDAALAQLQQWTQDPSAHVRRLVSEGTRPRLPWATRLHTFLHDPTPVLALLEQLRDDPSLYVRRSVANHLNDIYKAHPTRMLDTVSAWMTNATAERRWVMTHALRSAVKQGDTNALALLAFSGTALLRVDDVAITPHNPRMGGRVCVTCTLRNTTKVQQQVVVDLVVYFVKANGSSSPKVFKMSNVELPPGHTVTLRKTISVSPASHPRSILRTSANTRRLQLGQVQDACSRREGQSGLPFKWIDRIPRPARPRLMVHQLDALSPALRNSTPASRHTGRRPISSACAVTSQPSPSRSAPR